MNGPVPADTANAHHVPWFFQLREQIPAAINRGEIRGLPSS
jgi:hypothetical protein